MWVIVTTNVLADNQLVQNSVGSPVLAEVDVPGCLLAGFQVLYFFVKAIMSNSEHINKKFATL